MVTIGLTDRFRSLMSLAISSTWATIILKFLSTALKFLSIKSNPSLVDRARSSSFLSEFINPCLVKRARSSMRVSSDFFGFFFTIKIVYHEHKLRLQIQEVDVGLELLCASSNSRPIALHVKCEARAERGQARVVFGSGTTPQVVLGSKGGATTSHSIR